MESSLIVPIVVVAIVASIITSILGKKLRRHELVDEELLTLRSRYNIAYVITTVLWISAVGSMYTRGSDDSAIGAIALFIALFYLFVGAKVLVTNYAGLYDAKFAETLDVFALYLRPFDDDEWEKTLGMSSDMINAINRSFTVFMVGKPNKLHNAIGQASSIYLTDENWKVTVANLIVKSKINVIVVGNTEGCLWELAQFTEEMVHKTVFCINTMEGVDILNNHVMALGLDGIDDVTDLLDDNGELLPFYVCMNAGRWQTSQYQGIDTAEEIMKCLKGNDRSISESCEHYEHGRKRALFLASRRMAPVYNIIGLPNFFLYTSVNRWPMWLRALTLLLVAGCIAGVVMSNVLLWVSLLPLLYIIVLSPNISWLTAPWASKQHYASMQKAMAKYVVLILLILAVEIVVVLCIMHPCLQG